MHRFLASTVGLDLAPSDFYIFPKLKEFLVWLKNDDKFKTTILEWPNGLAAEFY